MREYKIICSDLDGTLLDSAGKISSENLAAISELIRRGVAFVPSTGRSFSELPAAIRDHPAIRYYICSNGTVLLDRLTGHCLRTCLSAETTGKILDILNACQTHISLRQDNGLHVDAVYATESAYDEYNVCQAHRDVIRDFAVFHRDFRRFSYEAENVEVVSVFFRDYAELLKCKAQLEQLGGLRIVGVSEYNLEILNVEAGKGNALRSLAALLGVDDSDTISLGDSDNDRSIIEAAGLGLAVSNACQALKAAADQVICSNDEHAIAYVLSHYY